MKVYKPEALVANSRYRNYFPGLSKDIQEKIYSRMEELIEEEKEYCDKGNYSHMAQILTSIAMYEVLQKDGKSEEEAYKIVSEEMWKFLDPSSMQKLARKSLEPEDSPVLTEGRAGEYKIQGIGAGFVPNTLNTAIYDEILRSSNEDAFKTARLLARKEGISVGISSGAALHGAIEVAKRQENKGKVIVVLLPDSGDRYYSTPFFTE